MQAHTSSTVGFTPWSLTLGSVRGIPIRLHISFILLLFWVGLQDAGAQRASIHEFIYLSLVFVCVFLHELGHALTAKRFGIKTREIMLYPFGGVASLVGEMKPAAELIIAIAGPLVNIVIAAILWGFINTSYINWLSIDNPLVIRLFEVNVMLAIFNCLPALPMDGGRILRATLSLLKVKNSTQICARVSQILSFSLGAFALYIGSVMLFIISVFVFTQAMNEMIREKTKVGAEGHIVRDAMLDRAKLTQLPHGTTVSNALKIALKSEQDLYPVIYGKDLMGIVSREAILNTAIGESDEHYVSGIMEREFAAVPADISLNELMSKVENDSRDLIVVVENGEFVGILRRERLLEFLYIQAMRKQRDLLNDDSIDEEFQL